MTLSIIGFLDFGPCPVFKKDVVFQKLDLFLFSGKGMGKSYSVGYIRKSQRNH
jgi:hypothetical protein